MIEAINQGLVVAEFEANGTHFEIAATLTRLVDRDIVVKYDPGYVLFSADGQSPSLVARRLGEMSSQGSSPVYLSQIELLDDSPIELVLETYSLEFQLNHPDSGVLYFLGGALDGEIAAILDSLNSLPKASHEEIQTAIWAITDGVSMDEVANKGYAPDLPVIRSLFDEAGLDTERKRLFRGVQSLSAGDLVARGDEFHLMSEYIQAIADYNQALELDPELAHAFYQRGFVWAQIQEFDKAISDFSEYIRLNPNDPNGYYARGIVVNSMPFSHYSLAVADLSKAIELAQEFVDAYHTRGLAYLSGSEFDKAIGDFTKAIELDPQFADALFARATAYGASKDFDNAIVDFTSAIELNPDFAEAYQARALAYSEIGEKAIAADDLETYLTLQPDAPDKAAVQDLIATLRGIPTPTPSIQYVSLMEAVDNGWVEVELRGLGVASGDSVLAIITPASQREVEITVPAGTVLVPRSSSESRMVVRQVHGLALSDAELLPTEAIRLSSHGPQNYFIEAYDLDFHKDSPGTQTTFSISDHSIPEVERILKEATEIPEGYDSVAAIQTAIWVVTEDLVWNDLVDKGPVPDLRLVQAILQSADIDPQCKRLFGGTPCSSMGIVGLSRWNARSWILFGVLLATISLMMVPRGIPVWLGMVKRGSGVTGMAAPSFLQFGQSQQNLGTQAALQTQYPCLEWKIPVDRLPFTIGNGKTADLFLNAPSISSVHSQITHDQGKYLIHDLSTNQSTYLKYLGEGGAERCVEGYNALRNGSAIRLDEVGGIVFHEQPILALSITVPISKLPWTIGSDEGSDLVLIGDWISGHHARLETQSGSYVVVPLATGNTYLSFTGEIQRERLLTDTNAIKHGSSIRIGRHLLTFRDTVGA